VMKFPAAEVRLLSNFAKAYPLSYHLKNSRVQLALFNFQI